LNVQDSKERTVAYLSMLYMDALTFVFFSPVFSQAYRLKRTKRDDPMAAFADSEELLEYDKNAPRKDMTDQLAGRDNTSVISNRYEL
jgi:hypothetical protein